jgi:hypothetical protein
MESMNRRTVLAAGLGSVALVGLGGVWRVTRTPDSAFEPWALRAVEKDDRLYAFQHAILAPNPHNRQPWVIRLIGDSEAVVTCDLDRRLPVTDPFDRQITIGFGTFLETARIAAAQRGVAIAMEMFPEGEPAPRLDARPIAHLTFARTGDVTPDPLFSAITMRRSNKETYDTARAIDSKMLQQVVGDEGFFSVDPAMIKPLREQILLAINTEFSTKDAYMESVNLMRIGYQEVSANPDGIDLSGPLIEMGIVTGQISRDAVADMSSSGYQFGLDQANETYGSVPALTWIKTPSNTRIDQIEAGRQYVRANLRSTQFGLAMHPVSQALQEYAEVADAYRAVHSLLGAKNDERIQMLARIGYGPTIGPSPRWPLGSFLR